MLESQIERKLVRWCRERDIACLKLNARWYVNIPDRLIVLPGEPNRAFFLELKKPGEKPRSGQRKRIAHMRRLGYSVFVADGLDIATKLIKKEALK